MAYLVVGRLLESLSGDKATALGVAVLSAIDKSLRITKLNDIEESENSLSPLFLRAIYAKPDDLRTASRTIVSLMAAFCKRSKSSDNVINWFAESSHKTLTTLLYGHANSDTLPPPLAKNLLRSLLATLREDALVFFASIWTDAAQHSALQVAALRHATAFVRSYSVGTDFQMALPSVLVAFTSAHKAVRDAAIGLMKVINRSASEETKIYYAIDTFYGKQSGEYSLLCFSGHADNPQRKYSYSSTAISSDIVKLSSLHSTRSLWTRPDSPHYTRLRYR